ncbi:hypothetical protein OHQ88_34350 (plasmid) [Micromonospora zamorensis]|uniref:hypothetical protein n=1 Tax=Micromonospora zamorensis TaxID=709883 RepID=UPI002E20C8F5
MHRRDYETVAAAVRSGLNRLESQLHAEAYRVGPLAAVDYDTARRVAAELAAGMADRFAADYHAFGVDDFLAACGLLEDVRALRPDRPRRELGQRIDAADVRRGDWLRWVTSGGAYFAGVVSKTTDRTVTLDQVRDLDARQSWRQQRLRTAAWSRFRVELADTDELPTPQSSEAWSAVKTPSNTGKSTAGQVAEPSEPGEADPAWQGGPGRMVREIDERLEELGWDDEELIWRAQIVPGTMAQLRQMATGVADALAVGQADGTRRRYKPHFATLQKLSTALGYPDVFLWQLWWSPRRLDETDPPWVKEQGIEDHSGHSFEAIARMKAKKVPPPPVSARPGTGKSAAARAFPAPPQPHSGPIGAPRGAQASRPTGRSAGSGNGHTAGNSNRTR